MNKEFRPEDRLRETNSDNGLLIPEISCEEALDLATQLNDIDIARLHLLLFHLAGTDQKHEQNCPFYTPRILEQTRSRYEQTRHSDTEE